MSIEPIEWKPKTWLDVGIVIPSNATANSDGEIYTTCPECSSSRKPQNQNKKCLGVNLKEGMWNCMNCENKGSLFSMTDEQREQNKAYHEQQRQIAKKEGRTYEPKPRIKTNTVKLKVIEKAIPEQKTKPLTNEWLQWLQSRGISELTANSVKLSSSSVYIPQTKQYENVICFNYYKNDVIVNVKYRDKNKNFTQTKNTERTLYGIDDINIENPLIWVEGEMDKLSFYEAGFTNCVSVPDGAPPPNSKSLNGKLKYIKDNYELLKDVKCHIIATDNDAPGKMLRDELVRRLSPERCKNIYWDNNIKDANDGLMDGGVSYLQQKVKEAKYCPIEGIIRVDDVLEDIISLYQNNVQEGLKIGYEGFDNLFKVLSGDFTLVTGIPGHGKSEFLDNCIVKLAKNHGFKTLICSPENQPVERHIAKLAEKWRDQNFYNDYNGSRMDVGQLLETVEDMNEYFTFILPEEPTISAILKRAKIEIFREGINALLIDPWNELQHDRSGSMSETEYISEALREMRKFARDNKIHLFLVAHPKKMQKKTDGTYEIPEPYDISGSANWNNKADNCITVFRGDGFTDVHIQKIRVKQIGKLGAQRFKYNLNSGTYTPLFASKEF